MEESWSTPLIPKPIGLQPDGRASSKRPGRHYSVSKSRTVRSNSPLGRNQSKMQGRVWFADELPGGQLADVVEVQCLKAEFAPKLWSASLCPLWSCSECTFVNEKPDALACLLCGTPRWENDSPLGYLDGIALRTSPARSKAPKEKLYGVRARPPTPARRSSSCSGQINHRPESGAVAEQEMKVRGNTNMTGVNTKMSGPQAPSTSSAVRASSTTSAGRHGATKAKKSSAEPVCRPPHKRVTEDMVDSMYALSSLHGSSRMVAQTQSLATKVPLKTPSPFRRLDLESCDLPPIGSPDQRIPCGITRQMDEPLGRQPSVRRPGSALY